MMKAHSTSLIIKLRKAFSLVEVVVALGIFSIAVISIVGLLVPVSTSVADIRDSDDAVGVVSSLQATLQKAGFDAVKQFVDSSDIIFADRKGGRVAKTDDAIWDEDEFGESLSVADQNAQKFFEIELVRNSTLSPAPDDDEAGFFALTMVLRWPGYRPDGTKVVDDDPATTQEVKDSQREQQKVLLVPVAITR